MDLKNKWVVLTGATSGIGLATAKALCEKGAHIIGVGRSQERCEKVKRELSERYPESTLDFLVADLSSLKNIRLLAEAVKKTLSDNGQYHLDVLINNAGTFTSWYMSTNEGFEIQFAVNHLAPFLLTHLLFSLLKNAPSGKIITLSSGSHYHTKIHWKDVLFRKHYNGLLAYKQSKLANVLFTWELRKRLGKESRVHAYAADPGLVNTEMGLKSTTGIAKFVWSIRKNSGDDPSEAAESLIYLATQDSVANADDIYFKACKAKKANPYALKEGNALRLWELSEKMCGIKSADYGMF